MPAFCGTHAVERRLEEICLSLSFAQVGLYLLFYTEHNEKNIFKEQGNDKILEWVINYLSDAETGARDEEKWRYSNGKLTFLSEDVRHEVAYHHIRDALNYKTQKKLGAEQIIEECTACKDVLEAVLRQEDIEAERYKKCSNFLSSVTSYYQLKRYHQNMGGGWGW